MTPAVPGADRAVELSDVVVYGADRIRNFCARIGDVILGIGGQPFVHDPRTELGRALTVA